MKKGTNDFKRNEIVTKNVRLQKQIMKDNACFQRERIVITKKMSRETADKRKERLQKRRDTSKNKQILEVPADNQQEPRQCPIHEEKRALKNIDLFHKSNKYSLR